MHIQCSCGKTLKVAANLMGKKIRCPSCREVVPVPEAEDRTLEAVEITSAKHKPNPRPSSSEDRYEGAATAGRKKRALEPVDDFVDDLKDRQSFLQRYGFYIGVGGGAVVAVVVVVVILGISGGGENKGQPLAPNQDQVGAAQKPPEWIKTKNPDVEAQLARKRQAALRTLIKGETRAIDLLKDKLGPKGFPVGFPGSRGAHLAFSPTPGLMATTDGLRIILVDLSANSATAIIQGASNYACGLAYSPDGKLIAAGDQAGNNVKIWDTATGALTAKIMIPDWKHAPFVNSVVYSPDGKTLAIGGNPDLAAMTRPEFQGNKTTLCSTIFFWDVAAGKFHAELGNFELAPGATHVDYQVRLLMFSPDGAILASFHRNGMLHLWDTATTKHLRTFDFSKKRPDGGVTEVFPAFAFAPDGWTLAAGLKRNEDGLGSFLTLLDLATGNQTLLDSSPHQEFVGLEFTPDGKHLLAGINQHPNCELRVWDVQSAKQVLKTDIGQAISLTVSPGGLLLGKASKVGAQLFELPMLLSAAP